MVVAESASVAPLSPGTVILDGRYRIDKVVQAKKNGMSRVYRVHDLQLNKDWCLKEVIVRSPEDDTPEKVETRRVQVDSLMYEYALMGILNTPAVPRALQPQYNEDKSRIWYLMDWVEGENAGAILRREGPIKSETVIRWGISLLETLGYLHENSGSSIVYRDMKPENIMISDYGKPTERVHLIDFGIARFITPEDSVQKRALGTRGYAPPEQQRDGVPFDTRWDLFALGATLFQLATGVSPVKAAEARFRSARVAGKVRGSRVPLEMYCDLDVSQYVRGVSSGLRAVILRATAFDESKRYPNASTMLVDMRRIGRFDAGWRRMARLKIGGSLAFVLVGVLIAGAAVGGYAIGAGNVSGQIENQELVARSSGSFDEWKSLAEMDPSSLEAYNGMLEAMRAEGQVTQGMEQQFLGVLMPNMSVLQREDGYGDLAYAIGQMYFFYYGDANNLTGQQQAKTWFNDAIQYGCSNKTLASDLYVVSSFQSDIQGAMRDGSDAGMYAANFSAIQAAINDEDESGGDGSVIAASLYRSAVDLVNNYSYKLSQEGIAKDDVVALVQKATNFASKTSDSDSTRVSEIKDAINSLAPSLQGKIDISYSVRSE